MSNNFMASAEVIHCYSRAQALEDGGLIDVSAIAKEAGFRFPVALTAAVWGDCVAWQGCSEKAAQDEAGRLWDVLAMATYQTRRVHEDRAVFTVLRVPRGGRQAEPVRLVAHIGPGDQGEPVITIMQPGED